MTTVWRSGVIRKLEAEQKLNLEGADFERVWWWLTENITPLASKHLIILWICGLALVTPRIGRPFLSWLGILSGVSEHGTGFPEVRMLKMRSCYSYTVGQLTLFGYICVEPCQKSTLEVRGGQMSSFPDHFLPCLGTQKFSQPPLALVWPTFTLDNR